ncbi:MAG: hypothetical protein R6W67_00560 [Bacteroidales bacterium]
MKKYLHIALILIAAGLIMPEAVQAQKTGTAVTTKEKKEAEVVAARERADLARKLQEQEMQLQRQQLDKVRGLVDSVRGQLIRHIPSGDLDMYFYSGRSQGSQSRGMPRTSWDFSRTLSENSSVKEYTFEVEKDMKNLSVSVLGMCKSGEIRIDILMPGNKSYSEVVIDEYGSLNWRKSFELNEDAKDKMGIWKFKVTTKNASGNFRISLSAS